MSRLCKFCRRPEGSHIKGNHLKFCVRDATLTYTPESRLLLWMKSAIGLGAFVGVMLLLLLHGCGAGVVNAQDDVFLRTQGDCSNLDHWLSGRGTVRVTYTDTKSRAQISYFFECHDGLLTNPVEEGRVR